MALETKRIVVLSEDAGHSAHRTREDGCAQVLHDRGTAYWRWRLGIPREMNVSGGLKKNPRLKIPLRILTDNERL